MLLHALSPARPDGGLVCVDDNLIGLSLGPFFVGAINDFVFGQ